MAERKIVWTEEKRQELWDLMEKEPITMKDIAEKLSLNKTQVSKDIVERHLLNEAKKKDDFEGLKSRISNIKMMLKIGGGIRLPARVQKNGSILIPGHQIREQITFDAKNKQYYSVKVAKSGTITLSPMVEETE